MEDYQRELENALADYMTKNNVTWEKAIEQCKEYMDHLLELKLMSKGVIKK